MLKRGDKVRLDKDKVSYSFFLNDLENLYNGLEGYINDEFLIDGIINNGKHIYYALENDRVNLFSKFGFEFDENLLILVQKSTKNSKKQCKFMSKR